MRKKRFTHIEVSHYVNVSSSCNYTVEVYFYEGNTHKTYWFDPQMGDLICKAETGHFTRQVPQYVMQAAENKLRQKWQSGSLKFFEYDQEGNSRYTNLRYHDPVYFARLIGAESGAT